MDFKKKLILAPMVGVNNIAFRKLCSDNGADIVYSQMIDSRAFIKGNSWLADFYDEKNAVAQFFGNDAKIIAECAKAVEEKVKAIDLNLGCPHSNVVERKCGAYLMKYPAKIKSILSLLVKSVGIPITVKMRAGYDKNHINAVKIAKLCEKEGVSAIAVHGRARTVNYEFPVDLKVIKRVKNSVNIPVIGNGDIFTGNGAKKMFEETNCDSIMIGRGAIGNPAVFNEIKCFLDGKKLKRNSLKSISRKYFNYCKKYDVDFKGIKSHAQWLTKGINYGGHYRNLMNAAKDLEEIKKIYESIRWDDNE